MGNPTIEELQNSGRYELIGELEHRQIKEFVIKQVTSGSRLVKGYMYYQLMMIILGIFFTTRPLVLAIRGNYQPLFFLILSIVFTFSFLILVHELLHAAAFKVTGAKNVSIGGYLKKFIFYAEADRHVMNRKQFTLVALTPLVTIQVITLAAVAFTVSQPAVYFWLFIMCAHSLFCAGDIGMLHYFYQYAGLYTFDVKEEKKSYYYREREQTPENEQINSSKK